MAKRRSTRATASVEGSLLANLDDNALAQVLLTAREEGTLGVLASSSRQLCSFARSRVPLCLVVQDEEEAGLVIASHTRGRPPFSACISLLLQADGPARWCMARGVLDAAQHWTALEQLHLKIQSDASKPDSSASLEWCTSSLLGGVAPLQHLRQLMLTAPALGASSAHLIMQLTQLTSLSLTAATGAAAAPAAAAAAAYLGSMARMTNLVELRLNWALAPLLPAGPEGPFCFPSSLVKLWLSSEGQTSAAPLACWLAHLPGCPQLQQLEVCLGDKQQHHHTAHPSGLVDLLAQHNRQLRTLIVCGTGVQNDWDAPVTGLPDAAGPVPEDWFPDAALAALTGLESLECANWMVVLDQAQWQHLVQLTALRKLEGGWLQCVPEPQAGSMLRLLQLVNCNVLLGGYDVGRLLLACPVLEEAQILFSTAPVPAPGERLPPHPKLSKLCLWQLEELGGPAAVVAQWTELAPVLSSVSTLELRQWPHSTPQTAFPDLSPCTALTALRFGCSDKGRRGGQVPAEQERFLSMVAPLVHLRHLELTRARRVNARIAFALQCMLPQLQHVKLHCCGKLVPVAVGVDAQQQQEAEQAALRGVQRLLRPGLVQLHVETAEDGE